MKYQVVSQPALTVLGIRRIFNRETGHLHIGSLWDEFFQWKDSITDSADSLVLEHKLAFNIGYEDCNDDKYGSENFLYMPAMVFDNSFDMLKLQSLKDKYSNLDIMIVSIPASSYAVFTHVGPVSGFYSSYCSILKFISEQNEFKVNGSYDFEYYDDRFKMDDPTSEIDLYFPISSCSR